MIIPSNTNHSKIVVSVQIIAVRYFSKVVQPFRLPFLFSLLIFVVNHFVYSSVSAFQTYVVLLVRWHRKCIHLHNDSLLLS